MNKQPSLFQIITIDYAAFLALLFLVIAWGVYIFLAFLPNLKFADFVLPAIYGAITVISIGVLSWRVQIFNTVFDGGLEAPATISNVSFFRISARVDYIYTCQGKKYTSSTLVHKVKQTQTLEVGAQVIVMVDRSNPKRAYIRDLYM